MSFLAMNVDLAEELESLLSENKQKLFFDIIGNRVGIYYDCIDWYSEPVIETDDSKIYLAGWFINEKYERNNLHWLKSELDVHGCIEKVSNKLLSGVFVCIYLKNNEVTIFSDPFSLSPHYYSFQGGELKISPSLHSFHQDIDENLRNILNSQGHLFGKYTMFRGVYRFNPGDIIKYKNGVSNLINNGYQISSCSAEIDVTTEALKLLSTTPSNLQSIALSAGFDSRFILSVSKPQFGYTWGPETSADVINGNKLANYSGIEYKSFSFVMNKVSEFDNKICHILFDGSVKAYNPQFFSNYRYVKNISRPYPIALDGYLGDVLQRGVYMTFGGRLGEFFKFFPSLTPLLMTPEKLLRKRYRKLNDEQFAFVYKDFCDKSKEYSSLDDLQKVTYYEFLYGRGLRYITTGAVVMNSCFKSVFPVFASRNIFNYFISKKAKEILNYSVFYKTWTNHDPFYRELKSEGAYSPKTKPILIPLKNFWGRVVTNYHPKHKNYTKEGM
ncbi:MULTISPECIES: hypothetical protein [Citrobacter]|uniref:hypothetical protein n=1 Tax=Citrobacter TaxID=544 RepID=UPI000E3EB603|nr:MULTISPECIES: hypothetical protein [Citrobacter]MBD0829903.1 hypothetical protein [Citrobacter sp. C1]RFU90117.1 hypothetical protein DZA29_18010 [Citrobacter gillenii]